MLLCYCFLARLATERQPRSSSRATQSTPSNRVLLLLLFLVAFCCCLASAFFARPGHNSSLPLCSSLRVGQGGHDDANVNANLLGRRCKRSACNAKAGSYPPWWVAWYESRAYTGRWDLAGPVDRDAYGDRVEETWHDQWMSIQASGAELKEQARGLDNLFGEMFDRLKEFS